MNIHNHKHFQLVKLPLFFGLLSVFSLYTLVSCSANGRSNNLMDKEKIGKALALNQTDTIYYDSDWERTNSNNALYYRTYPKKEENGYRIKDHYISGAVQMSALSLYNDEDWYEGQVIWYYESGQVKEKTEYKDGKKNGNTVYYDEQGNKLAEGINKNGIHYQGSFFEENIYTQVLSYYNNGTLEEKIETDFTGGSGAKIHWKLIADDTQEHYEIDYYDSEGERVGHCVLSPEMYVQEGEYVEYAYHPMKVLTIKKHTNSNIDTVQEYYTNGHLRSLKYLSGNNLETMVFYGQSGEITNTFILKDGKPYNGEYIKFTKLGGKTNFRTYKNGVLNGPFTDYYIEFNKQGQPRETGTYIDGEKDGEVTFFNKDGEQRCKGIYKKGLKAEGNFTPEFTNYIETYQNGKLTAIDYYYPDGKIYEHTLAGSISTYFNRKGIEIRQLSYKNGKPYNGISSNIDSKNGNVISEEHYQDGECIISKRFYPNGTVSNIKTYAGNRTSKETEYYPSGEKMVHTQYGKNNNRSYTYYDKSGGILGQLKDSLYVKNGEEYTFRNGEIQKVTHYDNGDIVFEKEYNEYGQLLYETDYYGKATAYNIWGRLIGEGTYEKGKPFDGNFCIFNDAHIVKKMTLKQGEFYGKMVKYKWNARINRTQIVAEIQYEKGNKNGMHKEYHNGLLFRAFHYVNGKIEGEAIFYGEDGNELSKAVYKKGNPFNGTVYKYDLYGTYNINRKEQYTNGLPNGEWVWFDNAGNVSKKLIYNEDCMTKEIYYDKGNTRELIYKDCIPFEGVKVSQLEETFYKQGEITHKKLYSSIERTTLRSKADYGNSQHSPAITNYYPNGERKNEIAYKKLYIIKDGKTTYYNRKGELIGTGIYINNMPTSGTFIYDYRDGGDVYLQVEIGETEANIYSSENGKKEHLLKYNLKPSASTDNRKKQIELFYIVLQKEYDWEYNLNVF